MYCMTMTHTNHIVMLVDVYVCAFVLVDVCACMCF